MSAAVIPAAGEAPADEISVTVRSLLGEDCGFSSAFVEELVFFVGQAARSWGSVIRSSLQLVAPPPVTVTLQAGSQLPQASYGEVRIALRPPATNLEEVTELRTLSHELVHALAGTSASQLLNEGLAVHVDERLRLAGSVWPFYDLSLHRWVELLRDQGAFIPFTTLITTPVEPLTRVYLEAGSYVRFLIDELGLDQFWVIFRSGVVLPEGRTIEEVERSWMSRLGGPLNDLERARVDSSLVSLDLDRRRGLAA